MSTARSSADGAAPEYPELRAPSGARLFDAARDVLLGSRCARCGSRFFPARALCPDCFDDDAMAEIELARGGVIYASTVVRVPSSLGHLPPYAYGYVDLADGVRVIGRFSGGAPESFVPGAAVTLVFEPLASAAGTAHAWAFRLKGQE